VLLAEITERPQYGWTTRGASDGRVKLLRTSDITSGRIDWDSVPYCVEEPPDLAKYIVADGDIVVSRAGSVGASMRLTAVEPAVFASYLIRFRPTSEVDGAYLSWFMRSPDYWSQIASSSSGIAMPNVNAKKLSALRIPLPPMAEQQEIVAGIEEQVSRLDAAVESLDQASHRLDGLIDAALLKAITGHLVTADSSEGSGRSVLDAITGESREGVDPAPMIPTPDYWTTAELRMVAETQLGKMLSKAAKVGMHAKPYLRNVNVQDGYFDLTDVATMDILPSELDRFRLKDGDLLVCEGGAIGRCAVWRNQIQECYYQKALHRVRARPGVSGDYLGLVLRSYVRAKRLERFVTGITFQHLPQEDLRLVPIPLPPTGEQLRIVSEMDRVTTTIGVLKEGLRVAYRRAASLRTAILRDAFSGRLAVGVAGRRAPDE